MTKYLERWRRNQDGQSLVEFALSSILFFTVVFGIGSFLSGALLAIYGWNWVNGAVFPVVAVAAILLALDTWRRRSPPLAEA